MAPAQDGKTVFVDGLRVTAEHLQHLQDRLHEGLVDLRQTLGLGQIAWGLRLEVADTITLGPGLAFATSGVRLALAEAATLPLPASDGSVRVILRAKNSDREALRLGSVATLIELAVEVASAPDDGSDLGADVVVVGKVAVTGGGPTIEQGEALFLTRGGHLHSGEFVEDAAGLRHWDGHKIPTGPAGPQGDKGDKGDKGDPGIAGDTGPKGDKGDQGNTGDKGNTGDTGPKGDPGNTGDKGNTGDPGPKGDKGDPGNTGDKGNTGDPGPKGDKGDPGNTGDKGNTGDPGPKGDKGDPGDKGIAGDAGPKGDKGDPGPRGDPGTPGLPGPPGATGLPGQPGTQGPVGPPGSLQTVDAPFVTKVSWAHNANVPAGQLPAPLRLILSLSTSLHPKLLDLKPPVIDVQFASSPRDTNNTTAPNPLLELHGRVDFEDARVAWTSTDDPTTMKRLFQIGGRLYIRVHCWHLFDKDVRQFSAGAEALLLPLLGFRPLHLPGGVLESWFTVTPG